MSCTCGTVVTSDSELTVHLSCALQASDARCPKQCRVLPKNAMLVTNACSSINLVILYTNETRSPGCLGYENDYWVENIAAAGASERLEVAAAARIKPASLQAGDGACAAAVDCTLNKHRLRHVAEYQPFVMATPPALARLLGLIPFTH